MAIKNNKRGYAFSFFSLFLVILIFFYAELQFEKDTFSSANNLEEYRIYSMNEEVIYFKDTYLLDLFDISAYKAMDILVNESVSPIVYDLYKTNYTMFNELVKELISEGTLDSTPVPEMEGYTLKNLTDEYIEKTQDNYFMNTSFYVYDLVVYEEDPMTIDIQALIGFNFTSFDNVSSWVFNETVITSFQSYNLLDPSFHIIANTGSDTPRISPVELYAANLNWSLELFNITLQNQFTNIYVDRNYRYSIGSSYLKNLFNITHGSYKDVFAFYSFDYDEELLLPYDTSQVGNTLDFFGDTLFITSLENHSNLYDESSYNHSIISSPGISNASGCPWVSCVYLNDSQLDYLEIQNTGNFDYLKHVSSSIWFNLENKSGLQSIMSTGYQTATEDAFEILLLDDLSGIRINYRCNVGVDVMYDIYPDEELTNSYNHIYSHIDTENGSINVFINGVSSGRYSFNQNICTNISFNQNIIFGANSSHSGLFANGNFDEIALYSDKLSEEQIGRSYINKKRLFVDYMDSIHGRGIYLNNGNYLNLTLNSTWDDFLQDNFTISFWFLPELPNATLMTYDTELSLGYNQSGIILSDNHIGNTLYFQNVSVVPNRYNHLVLTRNGSAIDVYLNKKKSPNVTGSAPSSQGNGGEITFGSSTYPSLGAQTNNFTGVFDEILFINRTLSEFDIERQYYNFESESKGCCNYLTLINPTIHGYNDPSYRKNVSYSSHLFFNSIFRNEDINITLYSMRNITTYDTSEDYYNFLVDNCMMIAYNIYGYASDGNGFTRINEGEDDLLQCSWLIKEGYY
ncbi:MAG: LamG-like jellyroll fold domain-containing protein [Nanoarchaeota archaeon]|nr:LamG-like jellyroll fold domain-containing protein [Nanoarchaeota archaeon]